MELHDSVWCHGAHVHDHACAYEYESHQSCSECGNACVSSHDGDDVHAYDHASHDLEQDLQRMQSSIPQVVKEISF